MRKTVTGLRAWLVQRFSAAFTLLYIFFFLGHFLVDPPDTYLAWRAWILSPGVSTATTIFFAALLLHVWVGVRDVLMDYVHAVAVRVPALALLALGLTAIGAWIVRILLTGRA